MTASGTVVAALPATVVASASACVLYLISAVPPTPSSRLCVHADP
jgi:hypothetical protein